MSNFVEEHCLEDRLKESKKIIEKYPERIPIIVEKKSDTDIPDIEIISLESPSPNNPLGIKGTGEGGTIGPPSVLAAAVEDALESFGVKITSTPLTPGKIIDAIQSAKQ